MNPLLIGSLGFLAMVSLILLGIPVWASLALVGVVGIAFVSGFHMVLGYMGTLPYSWTASYTLAVVPLFYLMGVISDEAGIAVDAYETANKWLSNMRGGLAMATTLGSGLFAATCGSSVANALLFSKIALPQMDRYKYSRPLSLGCIAASGTFAVMIPPSVMLVLYGILTELSIGKLLIAGLFPGILTVLLYLISIYTRCRWLSPNIGPAPTTDITWKEKIVSIKGTWGIAVLFCLVMGGIYLGIFTPSAAGAVGAFGAFLIALSKRRITAANIGRIGLNTGLGMASIIIILISGIFFARFLILSGFTDSLSTLITGTALPPLAVLGLICLMYIILGCVMDPIPMIICTISFVYPLIVSLGFDGIWFGIILVKLTEIGAITPPVGINLYVVASSVDEAGAIGDVIKGVVPFIFMDIVVLALLVLFPVISLFLPLHMAK